MTNRPWETPLPPAARLRIHSYWEEQLRKADALFAPEGQGMRGPTMSFAFMDEASAAVPLSRWQKLRQRFAPAAWHEKSWDDPAIELRITARNAHLIIGRRIFRARWWL